MNHKPVVLAFLVALASLVVPALTVEPSKDPTTRLAEVLFYFEDQGVVDTVLNPDSISPGASNLDENHEDYSPQIAALSWMALGDTLQLEVPEGGLDTREGYEFVTRYALATLYYSTTDSELPESGEGIGWIYPANFLDSKPVCDWYSVRQYPDGKEEQVGVVCDDSGTLLSLNMSRNALEGSLPAELGFLTSLEHICMDYNQLGGSIPDSFQRLTNLKSISLMENNLVGTLPSWVATSLKSLEVINLSTNYLTGRLPALLGEMEHLVDLALNANLLVGDPSEIFDHPTGLRNLKDFYLENNMFSGTLSSHFLKGLKRLEHLDMSDNALLGSVPIHLFDSMPELQILDLHDNDFTVLPEVFPSNNQTKLGMLALQKCQFDHTIPSSLSNLKNLQHLDLSQNKFVGDIPSEIGSMTNLTYLFLAQNDFDVGTIPSWLANLSGLQELDLKSTQRNGSIPDWLGDFKDLVLLDLDHNHLTGAIPESLGGLANLHILLLNRNNLTSTIPQSFSDLRQLKLMFIEGNNKIEGSLSDLFCENPNFLVKPVLVGQCDICTEECCTLCCGEGDECNKGTFVPDLDPMWQLGYSRVFFTFAREDYLEKNRSASYPNKRKRPNAGAARSPEEIDEAEEEKKVPLEAKEKLEEAEDVQELEARSSK